MMIFYLWSERYLFSTHPLTLYFFKLNQFLLITSYPTAAAAAVGIDMGIQCFIHFVLWFSPIPIWLLNAYLCVWSSRESRKMNHPVPWYSQHASSVLGPREFQKVRILIIGRFKKQFQMMEKDYKNWNHQENSAW